MNKFNFILQFLFIIIAIVLGRYLSNAYKEYYAPIIKIENNLFDFGNLKKGKKAIHYFKIKNIGKTDLVVSDILTKCGCTTPNWYKNTLKPNQIDSIMIKYDTNIIGAFTKYVLIESNSLNTENKLYIQGVVLE